MPRAYTACRSGCALLPSVHVELKKRKIIKKRGRLQTFAATILLKNAILKKRGSRESFDETIIKKYDFIEESPSCLFLMAFLCFLNILS